MVIFIYLKILEKLFMCNLTCGCFQILIYRCVCFWFYIWLRRLFCLYFNIFFRIFLPFFRERKKKDAPERRKKARGIFLTARWKSSRNTLRVLGFWVHEILPSCSRNYTKHQIKRKNGTNIPKMRVFYEHFCRNVRTNIIFTPQNSLVLLSEFSASR